MRVYPTHSTMWILLLALLMGKAGWAQGDPGAVAAQARRARDAFAAGRLGEAAQAYLAAYQIDADPSLLYNAAFIFTKTGELAKAETHFRAVTASPRADAELIVKAYRHLEDLARKEVMRPLDEGVAPPAAPVTVAPTPIRSAPPTRPPEAPPRSVITVAPATMAPVAAPQSAPPPGAAAAATELLDAEETRNLSPEQLRRLKLRLKREKEANQ